MFESDTPENSSLSLLLLDWLDGSRSFFLQIDPVQSGHGAGDTLRLSIGICISISLLAARAFI
jgi:hypothetical protein